MARWAAEYHHLSVIRKCAGEQRSGETALAPFPAYRPQNMTNGNHCTLLLQDRIAQA